LPPPWRHTGEVKVWLHSFFVPATLNTPVQIEYEVGWVPAQWQDFGENKNLSLPEFELRTGQSVWSRAIPSLECFEHYVECEACIFEQMTQLLHPTYCTFEHTTLLVVGHVQYIWTCDQTHFSNSWPGTVQLNIYTVIPLRATSFTFDRTIWHNQPVTEHQSRRSFLLWIFFNFNKIFSFNFLWYFTFFTLCITIQLQNLNQQMQTTLLELRYYKSH
jgi:hypothetical protein